MTPPPLIDGYRLVCGDSVKWNQSVVYIKECLNLIDPDNPFDRLAQMIRSLQKLHHETDDETNTTFENNLYALNIAIQETSNEFDFYKVVLPSILHAALELPQIATSCGLADTGFCIKLLRANSPFDEVILSRTLVHSILANTFLCNNVDLSNQETPLSVLHHPDEWGRLSWYSIMSCNMQVGIERIKCMLQYFAAAAAVAELPGVITIQRYSDNFIEQIQGSQQPLSLTIHVHSDSMEAKTVSGGGIVDFANRDLHIGRIIPSATQEEVLFSVRPELFVAMLFCQRMYDRDCIIIKGAPQIINYSGYLRTFRSMGLIPGALLNPSTSGGDVSVIAIDAVFAGHFHHANVLRDINKAAVAFSALKTPNAVISTGSWGCGVFGGDKIAKFLQQLIAAEFANVTLEYSTFHDITAKMLFNAVLDNIRGNIKTLGELFQVVTSYHGTDDPGNFHRHLQRSKILPVAFYF